MSNRWVFLFILLLGSLWMQPINAEESKNRLVILADMGNEPDEEQQMAHMLMYANEFDLEGLIAVSGKYLHDQRKDPYRSKLHPELFIQLINGYEKVLENLKKHAKGWPESAYLRSIVASGQPGYGVKATGPGKHTEGSNLLVSIFKKKDPRPIYIVVNAGSNTLLQALLDFSKDHSQLQLKALLGKLFVFENGAQDNAGAWICGKYPEINWIRSNYQTYGYGGPAWAWGKKKDMDKKGPYAWKPYRFDAIGQHQWVLEHIKNHGALGKLYPLRQTGKGKLVFIEGGGTIPWLGLIHQGLWSITKPAWGGWSGRFSKTKIKNVPSRHESVQKDEITYGDYYMHMEVEDEWQDMETDSIYRNKYVPVWRWRQAYFNDFKCRMDWCVASYKKANHNPVAAIDGDSSEKIHYKSAKPEDTLELDASSSFDPDQDGLKYHWWIYKEAGNYDKQGIKLKNDTTSRVQVTIPKDAAGKTIHIIFELIDTNSIASLRDYRRIIVSIEASN